MTFKNYIVWVAYILLHLINVIYVVDCLEKTFPEAFVFMTYLLRDWDYKTYLSKSLFFVGKMHNSSKGGKGTALSPCVSKTTLTFTSYHK